MYRWIDFIKSAHKIRIVFKIPDEVEKNIHKVDLHGRIVGDWSFNIPERNFNKANLVAYLSKMIAISVNPSDYLTCILHEKGTNRVINEWNNGEGDIIDWIKKIDIEDTCE